MGSGATFHAAIGSPAPDWAAAPDWAGTGLRSPAVGNGDNAVPDNEMAREAAEEFDPAGPGHLEKLAEALGYARILR